MTRAAEASGRVHQVAFTYRYLFGMGELRRRVRAGDVGEPYLFRAHHEYWDGLRPGATIGWRELRAPAGGGVLYDSGSHFFDLARFVLGPIAAVKAVLQILPPQPIRAGSGWSRRPSPRAAPTPAPPSAAPAPRSIRAAPPDRPGCPREARRRRGGRCAERAPSGRAPRRAPPPRRCRDRRSRCA